MQFSTPVGAIWAAVTEEVYERIRVGDQYARPIFLFSDNPVLIHLLAGSLRFMSECLEGHEVHWREFQFPFSSDYPVFLGDVIRGIAEDPLIVFRLGTVDEVVTTFGLTPERVEGIG